MTAPEFKVGQQVYTETKEGERSTHTISRRYFNVIWCEWVYQTENGKQFRECCLYSH